MVGRAGFFHRLVALPLPATLDSGLRRNDEWGAGLTKGCREWRMRGCRSGLSRIGVRDMLSYRDWRGSCLPPPLWIPAFAGMTN